MEGCFELIIEGCAPLEEELPGGVGKKEETIIESYYEAQEICGGGERGEKTTLTGSEILYRCGVGNSNGYDRQLRWRIVR